MIKVLSFTFNKFTPIKHFINDILFKCQMLRFYTTSQRENDD